MRSAAGFSVAFLADELELFGGNLKLFENLNAKAYFPIGLSHPLPGEKKDSFGGILRRGKACNTTLEGF